MRASRTISLITSSSTFVQNLVSNDDRFHFSVLSRNTELFTTPPTRQALFTVLRQTSKTMLLSRLEVLSVRKCGVLFTQRSLHCSASSRAAVPQNLKQYQRLCEPKNPQKNDFLLSQLSFLLEEKEEVFKKRSRLFYHVSAKSYWYAECYLWMLWGAFLVIVVFLFLGTYRTFSWNVIEPITYLFGYTGILCALWWYQRHGQEFSCTLFRKVVAERLYQRKIRKINAGCDSCRLILFHRPFFSPASRHRNFHNQTMEEEIILLATLNKDIEQLRILIDHEKKKK